MSSRYSTKSLTRRFSGFFGVLGSAIAVSGAMRQRLPADNADLKRLGIDPDQFHRIGRF